MPDVRELGYFVAVFEERQLSAAARRCFVSQPSVSVAVASLEQELGAELFLRQPRGVLPTAAAEKLYPIARRLVDETRALGGLFRERGSLRELRLGLMPSLDIPRVLSVIECLTTDGAVRLSLVGVDEPSDARIVSHALRRPTESFVPLWKEEFVVALPAAHPLARKRTLRPTDLAGARVIERCHCELGAKYARKLRDLEVVARATSEEWAIALVSAGVGIALVPEGSVHDRARVVTRRLTGVNVSRRVGIAYPERLPPPQVDRLRLVFGG
jgi:DNA-binding transcriptional LysR family regulator